MRRGPGAILALVVAAAWSGPVDAAQFDWDKWAAVANQHPCGWLEEATVARILGEAATATKSLTAAATSCTWKSADGALLLSASVSSFDTAANMVGEREGQLRDVATGRFERLATRGLTTAVLRNDRLIVTFFPNDDSESAVLRVQGHPVLREDKEQRAARKERLRAFTTALIEMHGL